MKTFEFLTLDHPWQKVGKRKITPHYMRLSHKHLCLPTRLESFVEFVDFDVYQKIRADFLRGRFYFLANSDEYAYMLLFDLMNGYPDDMAERDMEKTNDELRVLRKLSPAVEKFYSTYMKNAKWKESLSFPFRGTLEYEPIDREILSREHRWTMVDTARPLQIVREGEPLFAPPPTPVVRALSRINVSGDVLDVMERWSETMPYTKMLTLLENAEWKEYLIEREEFLAGRFRDLRYKPAVALHLYYDILGGQTLTDNSAIYEDRVLNELWALGQCL